LHVCDDYFEICPDSSDIDETLEDRTRFLTEAARRWTEKRSHMQRTASKVAAFCTQCGSLVPVGILTRDSPIPMAALGGACCDEDKIKAMPARSTAWLTKRTV
jgi:hypothetical protein